MNRLMLTWNTDVSATLDFVEGRTDVVLMMCLGDDGQISEYFISDVEPVIQYTYEMDGPEGRKSKVALVRFPKASYVFQERKVVVSRTVKIEEVLPRWLGMGPKLAATPEAKKVV
jgi:hypothetical protein